MKYLILMVALFTLAACGPVYDTEYELRVPESIVGKQCANSCYLERENCMQHCGLSQNACEARQSFNAQLDYMRYGSRRGGFGVGVGSRYYERYYPCPWPGECEEHCEIDYRSCFTQCGGEVIPHTRCVNNCENAEQPAPGMNMTPVPGGTPNNLPWDQK